MLKSYSTERTQFVSFSEYQSNCEKIDVGVPQCSVLGPLLFLIYINDLQNITSFKVLNFAIDALLYTTFKKKNTYIQDTNNLILKLKFHQIGL